MYANQNQISKPVAVRISFVQKFDELLMSLRKKLL